MYIKQNSLFHIISYMNVTYKTNLSHLFLYIKLLFLLITITYMIDFLLAKKLDKGI